MKRELGNDKHLAALIRKRYVHFAVLIVEDAQSRDLGGEVVGIGLRIALAYAEKDKNAAADPSHDLFVNTYMSTAYPLNDGTHSPI